MRLHWAVTVAGTRADGGAGYGDHEYDEKPESEPPNKQTSGAVYARTSDVDCHHGHHRCHWVIQLDGEMLLAGFEVPTRPSDPVPG